MPHVAITMYPGRDAEAKKQLADNIQKCVIDTLGVPAKVVTVSVEDVAPAAWAANVAKYSDEIMFVKPEA